MEKFNIGSETLWYSVEQATVVQIESNSETVVTGGGGGGNMHNGTGVIRDIHISSSTINRQTVYLRDAEGKQYAAHLTDWNISALQGHELVLIKVQSMYNSNYALIYNKTLGLVYHHKLASYFKKLANLTAGVYIIAAIIVICIACWFTEKTGSETVGIIVFIILSIFAVYKFQKHAKAHKKIDYYTHRLKNKLDEILEPY